MSYKGLDIFDSTREYGGGATLQENRGQVKETEIIKFNLLSSLPDGILHRICLMLGTAGYPATEEDSWNEAPRMKQLRSLLDGVLPSADDTAHSNDSFSPLAFASENTSSLQILRLCCKLMKRIVDDVRPSISFPLEDLHEVEPFLRKIPHISAVTLRYCFHKTAPDGSLSSLRDILPELTSLSVNDNGSHGVCKFVVGAVPLWGSTLLCLQLCGVVLSPNQNPLWRSNNVFGFLEELPMLQNLSLFDVTPHLPTEGIVGRTRLLSLDLSYSRRGFQLREVGGEDNSILDVSSCTALRFLRCVRYSLKQLLTNGLSGLLRVDYNINNLENVDLSSCLGLKHFACEEPDLQTIDVRGCLDLGELKCDVPRKCNIQVAGCSRLRLLEISHRTMHREWHAQPDISIDVATHMDLLGCTSLIKLKCEGVYSDSIDLEGCPNLECFDVSGDIKFPHFMNLQHLKTLRFDDVDAQGLLLSGFTSLEYLECVNCSQLGALSINGCSSLRQVVCKICPRLQDLDCAGCVSLKHCGFLNGPAESDSYDMSD